MSSSVPQSDIVVGCLSKTQLEGIVLAYNAESISIPDSFNTYDQALINPSLWI